MKNTEETVVEQVVDATPVVETPETPKIKTDSYTCPVTGNPKKTNSKQIQKFANKFGLSLEQAVTSLVSQEGRRQIKEENLTAEQVTEKYGVHPNVSSVLRCVVKPHKPRKQREKKVVVEQSVETTESPVDTVAEVVFVEETV